MQGIALSRRFYIEVVRPWLDQAAPGLEHAAALIGYGSELLGFDDEMSKDHNWGPRVHLLLARQDFAAHAHRLVREFSGIAPTNFLGEPIGWRSRPHPPASGPEAVGAFDHGLEIHTLEARLQNMLGVESIDRLDAFGWLALSEQRLLAFTAGGVFHDDGQRLTEARAALAYFPDDVWHYKIACQWCRITEEQAFVGRTGMTGDDLGSRVIAGRLVRDMMRLSFLLERRYAPYAKWIGRAFSALPIAESLMPLLQESLVAQAWQQRGEALAAAYLVLAKRQLHDGIGARFEPVIGPYHERPFATINADDIVAATLEGLRDSMINDLPVMGSIDQVSDLTPLLENPIASRQMMTALLG